MVNDDRVQWRPLGEAPEDKPQRNSAAKCAYPHTVPIGWKEVTAWSGIAETPVWKVRKGQHQQKIEPNVAYRIIEREMFFPEIMRLPLIHREVLQRDTFPDWGPLQKPSTKMRWRFLDELGLYSTIDDLKKLVDEYHQTRFL